VLLQFLTVAVNMPPVRKRKASTSLDDDDSPSSNVLVIKRDRLAVKSQVQYTPIVSVIHWLSVT